MKIISKFKDYYDYLQGVYGVDEKLILDRTIKSIAKIDNYYDTLYAVHIGEYFIYALFLKNRGYLYNEEIFSYMESEEYKKIISEKYIRRYMSTFYGNDNDIDILIRNRWHKIPKNLKLRYLGEKSPTWKSDFPILLENVYLEEIVSENIKLEDVQLSKVLSPHEIWITLSEWLSKRNQKLEKDVPIGDDNLRIVSHGFDPKTSFRPKMKNV
jgi:hypothetical protein